MKSKFNLDSRVVVVTGGAGLLGRAFAEEICANNGIAIIADVNEEFASVICDEINNKGYDGYTDYVKIDINSDISITNALNIILGKYSAVDALVNNAYPRNKSYGRDFFNVKYDDFCENISLNIGGYFLMSQIFSKQFIKQGHGNIINIASVYGVIAPRFDIYDEAGFTMPVEYAAIKSAIIHLTKYMAKRLKGFGIKVNCISPGGIIDKQPKVFIDEYRKYCLNKGMLDKEDISCTVTFLISDMSKFINGQNIIIDDGFTL